MIFIITVQPIKCEPNESSFYSLNQSILDSGSKGKQIVYGITACNGDSLRHADAISTDRDAVLELIHLLSKHDCDPIHLYDVIEDFFADDLPTPIDE